LKAADFHDDSEMLVGGGAMRARVPDHDGYVERAGVKVFYEVFGDGEPTILLMPAWSVTYSRIWKMQVPFLARHYRVITFDGRGNGRSDRPVGAGAYLSAEYAADGLAIMDATGTSRAAVVSLSRGASYALHMGAASPQRVIGQIFICPTTPLAPFSPPRMPFAKRFEETLDSDEGWAKDNARYWERDYHGFLEFFFSQVFTEPHSTKPTEDGVTWGLETTSETLTDTRRGAIREANDDMAALLAGVRCPCLVIQGTDDAIVGPDAGPRLAAALGRRARLVELAGSGHSPHARDPVKVNLLIREFVETLKPDPGITPKRWRRGGSRPKRALYISSPIGLGHARRDQAIADELRKLHPALEIDWLAQHPVTTFLAGNGERIHPASAELASESGHIEGECADHDLHCFQAWRKMDEILLANFMVFHDIVDEDPYDLWIGDEAWELDYYLHENPEQKRAAYAWLTDFVGWLPMPDGGQHEALLTADYNAEMIEHIARYPRVRDRAIFVGAPDDIVPDHFGPGLPAIRAWTEAHYDFSGDYITGFGPPGPADREAIRAELGYAAQDKVCIVTVGGSGVGAQLLRRVIDSFPWAEHAIPGLRMIVVAGPRIDPRLLRAHEGVEIHAYVPDLYRHLAVCDLAVVQGGLTTTMELVASNRPFLYFPLGHHFEQTFHVPYRLARYSAGRRMDYATATPEVIGSAIAAEIGKPVAYRPIDPEAVSRVARQIAEMI
jgi:pimeloyl-ACP methyl ester carboxylesterase/predicted glycosyltransferase